MAINKFIFLSPRFDARSFVQFLEETGRDSESLTAILEPFNDLKTIFWKGSRTEVISRNLGKLSLHSVQSSFVPINSINGYILDQYHLVIYNVLLFIDSRSAKEKSLFLGMSYENHKMPESKPGKKKILVPSYKSEQTITFSRGFYITTDIRKYEASITKMLIERGVNKTVIKEVIKKINDATDKKWFHINSSYNSFRWSISDIDKYVSGLYYDSYGKKVKPDNKTQQAIKHLIECYQMEHPYMDRKELIKCLASKDDNEEIVVEEAVKPRLIISLELKDKEQFLEFLRNRQINCQTKERYAEELPFPKDTSGESNRSTFIEQNVTIDTNEIDVYVNGELSTDIVCKVREYKDAYVAYLFYKGNKTFNRSFFIEKESAQEPIRHIRYNESDNSTYVDGKRITVTLQGYDDYKRSISDKPGKELSDKPTDTYFGKPSQQHKTLIAKQASVKKTSETVEITIKETSPTDALNEIKVDVDLDLDNTEQGKKNIEETVMSNDDDSKYDEKNTYDEMTSQEQDNPSLINVQDNSDRTMASPLGEKKNNPNRKPKLLSLLWSKIWLFLKRISGWI